MPQNDREAAGGARGFDAVVRRVLGEAEPLDAVPVERRAALGKTEPACVELCEQRDEMGRRLTLAGGQACDLCEQIAVRQLGR